MIIVNAGTGEMAQWIKHWMITCDDWSSGLQQPCKKMKSLLPALKGQRCDPPGKLAKLAELARDPTSVNQVETHGSMSESSPHTLGHVH